MKEARLYRSRDDGAVECILCNHRCLIADEQFGFCGIRKNVRGVLYTHAYGNLVAAHVDPIEKKPLYHFLPGSKSFSIATAGCNFRCGFCQNWEISQRSFRDCRESLREKTSPAQIVEEALRHRCKSISYTYTEPTVFFEYALETAILAREEGIANIFVTNGYMTSEALETIRPYLDAANVDLKFFNDDSYQRICKAHLAPVLESIRLMHAMGIWVEVTTLVIPSENDSPDELKGIADFIAGLDKNIPWHVAAFHPDYRFQSYSSTCADSLKMALSIGADAGLAFVYAGNVRGFGSDTECPSCKRIVIRREVFDILEYTIKDQKCVSCAQKVPGVFAA
ncbi:MAG: AmmeMemoRadiSam system radical SAM enzyme [Candidatus Omnitrophica bacterium]|nr:AmmeMemoRadiSam system radical SAM enzyme [Candidatus Omnitrophota bacterium]